MQALIDGDIVVYSNAASAENDPVEVAYMRIDQMMHSILDTTGSDTFRVFLSGSNNFRHEIYPEYKANRKDMVDPRWRKACKEYLVREWDAEVTDGYEADDALGINQDTGDLDFRLDDKVCKMNYKTIICSIDKDLDMIPGMHYSWPIVRKGVIVREGRIYEVSEIEGIKSFYRSLLVGDRTDNIFGVDGIGKVKAAQMIDNLETEEEMFERVVELYQGDMDRLLVNGKCLYIMREENKQWVFPSANQS
jgi:DNA polymerase-1